MDDRGTPSFWDQMVMQPMLTERERALRDVFVTEYLKDYDAWAAAIRVGFLKSVAGQYAQELMEDPYVRQEISRQQLTPDVKDPAQALQAKQAQIEASLLREAHYRGPGSSHGARVAALAKLAAMAKMGGDEDGGADATETLISVFREMAKKVPV